MGSTFGAGICWGLLIGFLLGWLMDLIFWRRNHRPADGGAANHTNFPAYSASVNAQGGVSGAGTAAASGAAALAAAALPSGVASFRDDDLEAIEGIGPKIAELLRNAGIKTFAQLAAAPLAQLSQILEGGGPRFKLANPSTWSEQAALAAKGDWAGFDKLKKELDAGVRSTDA